MEKYRVKNKLLSFMLFFIVSAATASSQLYLFPTLIYAAENRKLDSVTTSVKEETGFELKIISGTEFFMILAGEPGGDYKEYIDQYHGTCEDSKYNKEHIVVEGDVQINRVKVQGYIPKIKCFKWKAKFVITDSFIQNDLIFIDCIFEGGFEFLKSQFNADLKLEYLESYGNITMEESEFNGKLTFLDCKFHPNPNGEKTLDSGSVTIENNIFIKTVDFLLSEFNISTAFRNCRFHDFAIFGEADPNELRNFKEGKQDNNVRKAKFNVKVDFSKSIFYRKAFFIFTKFVNANFTDTIFLGPVHFIKAKFYGDTDFVRTDFNDLVDFDRAIFAPHSELTETGYTNFYRSRFSDTASFSKTIFITETDFKRASFKDRAFFTNTLFLSNSKFEMSFFDREFFGSKINNTERLLRERVYYNIRKNLEKNGTSSPYHDELNNLSKKCEVYIDNHIYEKSRQVGENSPVSHENCTDSEMEKFLSVFWQGKFVYFDDDADDILSDKDIASSIFNTNKNSCNFIFKGAHFNDEVDMRESIFGEVDFSSGEMITFFNGPVDFSKAQFKKIYLDDTTFMNKVRLSLSDSFFNKSGLISERSFFVDFLQLFTDNDNSIDKRDALDTRDQSKDKLKQLYSHLEPLFRKNLQVVEANEMSVRKARINLNNRDDVISSFFIYFALPIWNIFYITLVIILYFYIRILICIFFEKRYFGRIHELHFKPGKIPLIVFHNLNPDVGVIIRPGSKEKKEIRHAKIIWQKITWPLFLCLGTFFALLSLGNEYVTNDAKCLNRMKFLRAYGFILLPLFLFSLAKRSIGMHSIVSFLF